MGRSHRGAARLAMPRARPRRWPASAGRRHRRRAPHPAIGPQASGLPHLFAWPARRHRSRDLAGAGPRRRAVADQAPERHADVLRPERAVEHRARGTLRPRRHCHGPRGLADQRSRRRRKDHLGLGFPAQQGQQQPDQHGQVDPGLQPQFSPGCGGPRCGEGGKRDGHTKNVAYEDCRRKNFHASGPPSATAAPSSRAKRSDPAPRRGRWRGRGGLRRNNGCPSVRDAGEQDRSLREHFASPATRRPTLRATPLPDRRHAGPAAPGGTRSASCRSATSGRPR